MQQATPCATERQLISKDKLCAVDVHRTPTMEPPDCPFHIGEPGQKCRRCGAAWLEHNGIALPK